MDNITNREHFSISQVNEYLKCGMSYYYKYVEGLPLKPMGHKALQGSAIDDSSNKHFTKKIMLDDQGMNEQDFIDNAVYYHDTNKEEHSFDEPIPNSRDKVARLGKLYHETHAQTIDAFSVQSKLETTMEDTKKFLGYADLVTTDGTVIDNKVTGKLMATENNVYDKLSRHIQIVKYADILNLDSVGLAVLHNLKTPVAYFFKTKITTTDKAIVNKRIEMVWNSIKARHFLPTASDSWACSEKWCSFYDICEFGRKR